MQTKTIYQKLFFLFKDHPKVQHKKYDLQLLELAHMHRTNEGNFIRVIP